MPNYDITTDTRQAQLDALERQSMEKVSMTDIAAMPERDRVLAIWPQAKCVPNPLSVTQQDEFPFSVTVYGYIYGTGETEKEAWDDVANGSAFKNSEMKKKAGKP